MQYADIIREIKKIKTGGHPDIIMGAGVLLIVV